ncbi:hypothetical protein ACSIGC_08360 [Tenacibaculum sp. ZS6-P6]|uniref:hypothetical protein n=1 Tax=Tenacibaculum sp. ZS6-P6 TaxID=3447503 RepID=UPI003F9A7D5E
MKAFITLVLFLSYIATYSQSKREIFNKRLDSITSNYKGAHHGKTIIQSKLLNERLTNAFNYVIFNNSDLVDNASAFGVSLNDEKTRVSVNTNFHLWGESKHQFFLKAGINANGSGSFFNLYSRGEWQSNVGGNLGLIWKFKASGLTNEGKNKLNHNKVLRKIFIRDSITKRITSIKKNDYKNKLELYLNALKKGKNDSILKRYFKDLKNLEKIFKAIEKYKGNREITNLDFKDYTDSTQNKKNYNSINKLIDLLWSQKKEGNRALSELIKETAYVYDKKNIKSTGYNFWWLDANVRLNNNSFNFSEKAANINETVLADFNALEVKKTGINRLNTVVSLNLNWTLNKRYSALYTKAGLQFNSGSFLNSNLINGTAEIAEVNTDDLFIIKDEDEQVLGSFDNIDKTLQYGAFNLYGAYFFGEKKVFGLNLSLAHRFKIKTPANSFYQDNYSLLFGPVFRKPKDNKTGLTFGIDIGFDNARYDKNAYKNFVARIRVGIPFNLYKMKN